MTPEERQRLRKLFEQAVALDAKFSASERETIAAYPEGTLRTAVRESLAVLDALDAAEAIVEKLPKTADKVTVVDGMTLWPPLSVLHDKDTGEALCVHPATFELCTSMDFDLGEDRGEVVWSWTAEECYSTCEARDAAEAAQAAEAMKGASHGS